MLLCLLRKSSDCMSGGALVLLVPIIFLVSLSAAALHQPLSGIRWEDRSLARNEG